MKGVRNKGFAQKTNVNDALQGYLKALNVKPLQSEEVKIPKALGRVLAEDVKSGIDVPHFDRSAVDGYAVRSEDTYGASITSPVVFDMVGSVDIGQVPIFIVKKLEAASISTGAPIPEGTDAVVMQEYTERIGMNKVEIYRPLTPWKNVSIKGEDVNKLETVLKKGTILQPQDIGVLAAIARTYVRVVKRPKVAIISTGNELVEPRSEVEPGKIVDVNCFTLSAAVEDSGGKPLNLGIVKDDVVEIKIRISEGLKASNLVLVSGGTSVGKRDLVPEAVNLLGKPGILVHGMAMRPGMPTALASVNGKPVILLSGFPVAALIGFNVFAWPVISRMLGISIEKVRGQVVRARMVRRVPSRPGIREFVRVVVEKDNGYYVAEPIRTTGSSLLSSMVKANGLLVIPEEKEGVEEGEEVEIALLRHLED